MSMCVLQVVAGVRRVHHLQTDVYRLLQANEGDHPERPEVSITTMGIDTWYEAVLFA